MTHKRKRLIFALLLVSVAVGVFMLSFEESDLPIWAELPPLEQALPRGTVVTPYSDGLSSVDFKQEVVNEALATAAEVLGKSVGNLSDLEREEVIEIMDEMFEHGIDYNRVRAIEIDNWDQQPSNQALDFLADRYLGIAKPIVPTEKATELEIGFRFEPWESEYRQSGLPSLVTKATRGFTRQGESKVRDLGSGLPNIDVAFANSRKHGALSVEIDSANNSDVVDGYFGSVILVMRSTATGHQSKVSFTAFVEIPKNSTIPLNRTWEIKNTGINDGYLGAGLVARVQEVTAAKHQNFLSDKEANGLQLFAIAAVDGTPGAKHIYSFAQPGTYIISAADEIIVKYKGGEVSDLHLERVQLINESEGNLSLSATQYEKLQASIDNPDECYGDCISANTMAELMGSSIEELEISSTTSFSLANAKFTFRAIATHNFCVTRIDRGMSSMVRLFGQPTAKTELYAYSGLVSFISDAQSVPVVPLPNLK